MGNEQGDEGTTIKTFWELIYKLVCKFPLFSAIVTIVLIFVGAFGTAAYYILREADNKNLMDAESKEDRNLLPSKANFRGFYVDGCTTAEGTEFYMASEEMTLHLQSTTASARAKGYVRVCDKYTGDVKKVFEEWQETGHRNDNYLSLSYRTVKEGDHDATSPSIGIYLLKSDGPNQYTGFIIGYIVKEKKMYQCPYLLTDDLSMTLEQARNYPFFQKLECTPITFPGW